MPNLALSFIERSITLALLTPAIGVACDRPSPHDEVSQTQIQASTSERARMQQFLDRLQPTRLVAHTFERFGEQVDCVPILQQPALSGTAGVLESPPAPPLPPPGATIHGKTLHLDMILKGDFDLLGRQRACPKDTVPLRHWTIDDLQRWATLDDWMGAGKVRDSGVLPAAWSGHGYAARTQVVSNWGIGGNLNIWTPFTRADDEFSLVQIWAVSNPLTNDLQSVEAGFQRYHKLYGDWATHFFIYSTKHNYDRGTNCNNGQCNFVIYDPGACLGCIIDPTSQPGGDQFETRLQFYKAGSQGSWWLYWDGSPVGYFPRSSFNEPGMATQGEAIQIGAEIAQSDRSRYDTVDMGSGYYPSRGYGWAAYVNAIWGEDIDDKPLFRPNFTWKITDSNCWDAADTSDAAGVHFLYGGIGAANSSCTGP